MDILWLNILLIFVFFFLGAIFAGSEMALVTLRESQIKSLARKGSRGKAIKELTDNPNRFLSAVQIGVTLSGFLSASFGGATLAERYLAPLLVGWGMLDSVARIVSLVLITVLISFLSIVLSELTAKRLALQNPESFALALAPFINSIAKISRPLIWLLGVCTNAMVRLLGGDPKAGKDAVTDEELRAMVASASSLGDEERRIVDELFDAVERTLREVMVPRTEVEFLPGDIPAYKAIKIVRDMPHSRYPVTDGSPDRVVGFLHVRDLMDLDPDTRVTPISQLVRPVLSLPHTVKVLYAMTVMRRTNAHLAIVMDEYDGTAGIVTLEDLVEEIIGEITDEYDVVRDEEARHDSHREIAGLTTLEEFGDRTGYELPEGPYDTVAGYLMALLGRVPEVGDSLVVQLDLEGDGPDAEQADDEPRPTGEFELTVIEMDGRRVDWLRVRRLDEGVRPVRGATAVVRDENQLVRTQQSETRAQVAQATVNTDPEE